MRMTAAVGFRALLCGATLSLAGCHKRERAPEIDGPNVRIEIGTADLTDPDDWSSLRVLLRNQGETFRGELEVVGLTRWDGINLAEDPIRYHMELEVPGGAGAFRQVDIPVRAEGWQELEVRLFQPGYGKAFRKSLSSSSPGTLRILAIEDEPHDFASWRASLKNDFEQLSGMNGTTAPPDIIRLRPKELPTIAEGYSPFQMVLLHGPTLVGTSDEALSALEGWIHSGGTVLVVPGPSWGGNLPAKLRGMLGIEQASPESGVTPVAEAKMLKGRGAYHFALGLGRVTGLTRPLGSREEGIPSPARRDSETDSALTGALARSYSFAGSSPAGLRSLERNMGQVLGNMVGFHVPDAGLIFLCLFTYALVGCVLPYLIFKRRKRAEWAYAVMLGAALLAIGAIWGFGALTSLREAQSHEVTIVRLSGDGTKAQATSFLGLASPGFKEVDVSALFDPKNGGNSSGPSFRGVRAQPCRGGSGGNPYAGYPEEARTPRTTIQIAKDGSQRLEPFTLYPNSLRSVRIDSSVSLASPLRIESPADDGSDEETKVVSSSDQPLQVSILEGKRFTDWLRLEPGGSSSLKAIVQAGRGWSVDDPNGLRNMLMAGDADPEMRSAQSWVLPSLRAVLSNPRNVTQMWNQQILPPALPDSWAHAAPRYLIATSTRPFLPALSGFESRQALTCYVIELPPEVKR